ncbi:MAG: methyltransferase [Candidatus Micrarchaeota archaeon]|nr:methyltransferase [Candidatus Micrarchaeota archaeon]MDE1847335.1 methyltransferase [Candidatus Micrarchaeota archaeon]MDE1863950.1 methyltransferase [Candidatus Micrarchaeota archaeon]
MIEYMGLNLATSEKVYEPSEDSFLAAAALQDTISGSRKGSLRVLDIGTGTGILGILAAQSAKVSKVAFVDIDPAAISLARRNLKSNALAAAPKCEFILGSLFSKVRGKFDIITFNAPYLPSDDDAETVMAWNGGKSGVETCIGFVRQLGGHLSDSGSTFLVVSSFGDLKKLRKEIRRHGFSCKTCAKRHIFFEDIIVLCIAKR